MPSDPLATERLYRQTLYEIHEYVRYCYACVSEELPAALVNTLQHFEDLHSEPFSPSTFRSAVADAAKLMTDYNLALGADDKERNHILADLADLGFFLEDDMVHNDFVV
jgi:hypothetical protein